MITEGYKIKAMFFESIISLIKQYDTIIIHRHSKPDGDALGSQIGLKHLIVDNYPEKRVFVVGDAAGRYSFMKNRFRSSCEDVSLMFILFSW